MRLLCLALLCALALPAQKPSGGNAGCSKTGAVFGVNAFGSFLSIKDSSGYIETIEVTPKTKIARLSVSEMSSSKSVPMDMKQIQTGDLVCVQAIPDSKAASQITVVTRGDVDQAQQKFVKQWKADSVAGKIMQIDKAARKITVGNDGAVSLPPDVRIRSFPNSATQLSEGSSMRLEDLQNGDFVYIHGRRSGGDPVLKASTVIKGGPRAIIGSFIDSFPLQTSVKMREHDTGTELMVRIPSGELYRTIADLNSPYRIPGPGDIALTRLGFSDLQKGDIVLILGTADGADKATGLVLITRFGYFGQAPGDSKNELAWFLK